MFYHYTSLDTFLAILHGIDYRNEEPFLHLHASRIDTVNDPTEMTIDKKTFLSIVQHYEDNNIDPSIRISKSIERMDDDKFRKILDTEKTDHRPYVICLSKEEDYLPMWSLYGDKGRGVCLGFSAIGGFCRDFFYREKIQGPCTLTGDVSYKNHETSEAILRCIGNFYDKDVSEEKMEDAIADMYIGVSPFIKHPGYEYENEYRICIYNYVKYKEETEYDSNEEKTEYDSEEEHIYVGIPIKYLKTVTLGPRLLSTVAFEILHDYFSKKKLQIVIKESTIPFCATKRIDPINPNIHLTSKEDIWPKIANELAKI